jgi:hypothetical protein
LGVCRLEIDDLLNGFAETRMTEKEKTLIAGCVKGEKAAWDALVLQYSKLAFSKIRKTFVLHHALPQDDLIEDLHQDCFLSVCENDFRLISGSLVENGFN